MSTWSEERVETLKQRVADGLSASQIGNEFGVTRNTIMGKASRLGLRWLCLPRGYVRPATPRPRKPSITVNAMLLQRLAREKIAAAARAAMATDLPPDLSPCAIPFLKAGAEHCRWPLTEPTAGMLVCGAGKVAGAYCARHARIAYPGWRG